METISCLATKPNAQTHDPADREQLVIDYLPQVKIIARKIAYNLPRHVDLQELESAGVMGLLDAAQKFNHQRGVKFRTYAEHRIRGAILDSLRKIDWSPRSLRTMEKKIQAAYRRLELALARTASHEEVCAEMGISLESFYKLLRQLRGSKLLPLSAVGIYESSRGFEVAPKEIADPNPNSPPDVLLKLETHDILTRAIESLPQKQRLVMLLYYYDELTMRKIGQILGINESRVSQLHSAATHLLKGRLKATYKAA
jgi:RNA polymerase sigma factor for flagellar operon FliA